MNCPKCGRPMQKGAPHGGGHAQWECRNCNVTEPIYSKAKENATLRLEKAAVKKGKPLPTKINQFIDSSIHSIKGINLHAFGVTLKDDDSLEVLIEVKLPMPMTALSDISSLMLKVKSKFGLKETGMEMKDIDGCQHFFFRFAPK